MWKDSDNRARTIALQTLGETIAKLRKAAGVSELAFKEEWLTRLQRYPEIIASGWYSPPPDGITVLAAAPPSAGRLTYLSLRSTDNWPSERTIDWQRGLLMAYACPIDRATGLAGDVAVTLYFGSDPYLVDYFRRAYFVVSRLLKSIVAGDSSSSLINRADRILAGEGLRSCVSSVTDTAGYNIGHTIPRVDPAYLGSHLTDGDRESCRLQRRFVNSAQEWQLKGAGQFSVEPQIRCAGDPSLPQLTFHYLVRIEKEAVLINRDVDALLWKYGINNLP